jgi:uncharacterized protein
MSQTPPPTMNYAEGTEQNPQARTMGMLAHLTAFSGFIIPFGNIIGPLVIWLINKDKLPFAADQGKEALNFNICVTLAMIVSGLLMLVIIGIILLPVVAIAWIVLTIMATIKANSGIAYRYPFIIRLIK